ncbi:MAG TPA: Stp1/IreP family PP2C-type Ser/Thr phosphatase [Chitinophagaceae bacterium]|nr:Stp1/IreP family PP2C-type Ser/Thr phosphatase [Chitinophagaceae bacterium]MCB9054788.1 Stp1/IreP family PP2C-type Ser/Thr phosphatase [Chitinophagales bacterium]HRX93585.1 Stp1/IreP family PP2C-type Ser/Thr phosphatase [Chitinophagaceae bacterium]
MFLRKLFGSKKNKKTEENTHEVIDSGNIRVVIQSDLGNIRLNNEDLGMFFRVADEKIIREKGYLLIVADGMGGHQAGEVASKMATETISQEYFKKGNTANTEAILKKAFEIANKNIFKKASTEKSYYGMGTTCTAIAVIDKKVFFAHVGDSRAYFIRKNNIRQITTDHTYVQELVKSGEITPKEAETHPKRNILTNAMGTKPDLRIDTGKFEFPFEKGDKLLLCSDGLYDYIGDEEMAKVLGEHSLQDAADYMISETKKRGGHDNITVVLAEKIEVETTAKETRDIDLPLTKEHDLL